MPIGAGGQAQHGGRLLADHRWEGVRCHQLHQRTPWREEGVGVALNRPLSFTSAGWLRSSFERPARTPARSSKCSTPPLCCPLTVRRPACDAVAGPCPTRAPSWHPQARTCFWAWWEARPPWNNPTGWCRRCFRSARMLLLLCSVLDCAGRKRQNVRQFIESMGGEFMGSGFHRKQLFALCSA